MRAALVLPSQFPNGEKLNRQGVNIVYKSSIPPGGIKMTQESMDELRKFFLVGLQVVPTWWVSMSGFNAMTDAEKITWAKDFAKICSDEIDRTSSPSFFSKAGPPKQCYLNADNEYQSSLFMIEFHREFRRLRNLRILIWSLQGMQGGWMSTDLVQRINGDTNFFICPFHYDDNMNRLDGSVVTLDLIKQGIHWSKITGYKSLRQGVEKWWDGILYLENWEQLPA